MVIMVSSVSSSRSSREGFRRPSDREDIVYQDRGQLGLSTTDLSTEAPERKFSETEFPVSGILGNSGAGGPTESGGWSKVRKDIRYRKCDNAGIDARSTNSRGNIRGDHPGREGRARPRQHGARPERLG